MNIFLRRQGLGLDSIRNITSKMNTRGGIFRIDLGSRLISHDYAFNWGNVDLRGYTFTNLVNSPEAIREISNKGKFRRKLYEASLAMFTTNLREGLLSRVLEGYKMVVRPANHFGGSNIHLVTNRDEVDPAIRACGSGWYASDYIQKESEYRVFIVQGRVVYVVQKIVEDTTAIAWNVHQGGRFENVSFDNWNLRVVKASVDAFTATDLDFGAVDIIVGRDGAVYVLEINSAPAMTSEYWTECVAKAFDYIVANGVARIPLISERGGWRKFIHPAINDSAQIPDSYIGGATVAPRTRIERRPVQRTRDIQHTVNWRLAFSGDGRISDETYELISHQILDRMNGGDRLGTATYTTQETYTDYEDVELTN